VPADERRRGLDRNLGDRIFTCSIQDASVNDSKRGRCSGQYPARATRELLGIRMVVHVRDDEQGGGAARLRGERLAQRARHLGADDPSNGLAGSFSPARDRARDDGAFDRGALEVVVLPLWRGDAEAGKDDGALGAAAPAERCV